MKYHRIFAIDCSTGDVVEAASVDAAISIDPPDFRLPHGIGVSIGDIIGLLIEDEDGNVLYRDGAFGDEGGAA